MTFKIFLSHCRTGNKEALSFLEKDDFGLYEYPEIIAELAAADTNNNSVLHAACWSGLWEVVAILLEKKADGSYIFPEVVANIATCNNYILLAACRGGDYGIVARLLGKIGEDYEFPSIITSINIVSRSFLYEACCSGKLAIVQRLLAKKPDDTYEFPLVWKSLEGLENPALSILCMRNCKDIFAYLMGFESIVASITIKTFEAACYGGNKIIAENLLAILELKKMQPSIKALMLACERGNIEIVSLLLVQDLYEAYKFPELVRQVDYRVFQLAALSGNSEITKLLARLPQYKDMFIHVVASGTPIGDDLEHGWDITICGRP